MSTNLSPQTFSAIDSDAYSPDSPEHAGLDFLVRRQLKFLGAEGSGAAASTKILLEVNTKKGTVHPTALFYTVIELEPSVSRINMDIVVKGSVGTGGNFGDDFEFFPFIYSGGTRTVQGGRKTPAELTGATTSTDVDSVKIPLHFEKGVTGTLSRKGGVAIVGVGMQRINFRAGGTTVEVTGKAKRAVLNTDPAAGSQDVYLYNTNGTQHMDVQKWEPGAFPGSSDDNNIAFTNFDSQREFNAETMEFAHAGWVRPYGWQVSLEYDEQYVDGNQPYPLGMIRPNVEPRMDRGGGAAYRTANEAWSHRRLSSIGFEPDAKPSHWDRPPTWRFVDSDESRPTEIVKTPTVFDNDGTSGAHQLSLIGHFMVFGVIRDSFPGNPMDHSVPAAPIQQADFETVDYTMEVVADDGTVLDTETSSLDTGFYPVDPSGRMPFLQQAFLAVEEDTSGGDNGFTDNEGLLWLRDQDIGNDLFYVDTHTLRLETNTLPDDTSKAHSLQLTADLSNVGRSDLRLYILSTSTQQRLA